MAFVYPTILVGSEPYNVYADRAFADNYTAASFGIDAWNTATDANKDLALITATRLLDRQNWQGEKTTATNDLEWPRSNIEDVDSATLPEKLQQASVEMAVALVGGSTAQTARTTEETTKRLKAGSVEIENFRSTGAGDEGRFPLPVQELIGQWLDSGTSLAPVATGTDGTDQFEDDYGFSRGL